MPSVRFFLGMTGGRLESVGSGTRLNSWGSEFRKNNHRFATLNIIIVDIVIIVIIIIITCENVYASSPKRTFLGSVSTLGSRSGSYSVGMISVSPISSSGD